MSYLDDLFSLDGKVAVAIGAGGVLAGAMADALGAAGARVAVLDLNGEAAEARAEAIRKAAGVEALGVAIDATSEDDLRKALGQVLSLWGRVDVMLNAPGINSGTPFFEITEKEWNRIISVNLTSIFLACQIFGQEMVNRGEGGSIINISSASSGPPLSKVFTYSITKAGVNNLTQFLAREWAPSAVRVNAVAPGFFPAEQNRKLLTEERTAAIMGHTPMNRFGEAEELAGAVVWLASEKASGFVTGAIIRVDGGFTAMTI
ncbi:MAG: SDR family oxidoreductase [Acidobacteria bacterium]|jgi:NAD(P)-dependent dehydrogenase (short-subunit alcohol dehydrogenase family)|nr:SDR family oxidoreductase [Acidobacteriota bacterium]